MTLADRGAEEPYTGLQANEAMIAEITHHFRGDGAVGAVLELGSAAATESG